MSLFVLIAGDIWHHCVRHSALSLCLCFCRVCDLNIGRVVLGDQREGFASPVAEAVLELLSRHGGYLFVCLCVCRTHVNLCKLVCKTHNLMISLISVIHFSMITIFEMALLQVVFSQNIQRIYVEDSKSQKTTINNSYQVSKLTGFNVMLSGCFFCSFVVFYV